MLDRKLEGMTLTGLLIIKEFRSKKVLPGSMELLRIEIKLKIKIQEKKTAKTHLVSQKFTSTISMAQ